MANMKKCFFDVTNYMKEHKDFYVKRFNGAANENWLRTEINAIINFETDQGISNKKINFMYDEDKKRDLSIYNIESNEKEVLTHHIELKSIYASQNIDKKLKDAKEKVSRPNLAESSKYIWLFFTWTNWKAKNKKDFFSECRQSINQNLNNGMYTPVRNWSLSDLFNESFKWRGEVENTEIAVKSILLSKKN